MVLLCSQILLAIDQHDSDGPASVLALLLILAVLALLLRYILSESPPAEEPPDFQLIEPPTTLAPHADMPLPGGTPPRVTLDIDEVNMVVLRPPQSER